MATVITAFVGTVLMGLYANRPYAVAPFMAQNALVVYALCGEHQYSWQLVMGANLVAGIVFTLFVLSGLWVKVMEGIPAGINRAFTRGMGFFIAYIGFYQLGTIIAGTFVFSSHYVRDIDPVRLVILLIGFIIIGIMMIRKIAGALAAGMIIIACLAFLTGIDHLPQTILSAPPALTDLAPSFDIAGALTPAMVPVIALFFLLTFFDSIAPINGLFLLMNPEKDRPELAETRKPFLVNGISMILSPLTGTTTAGMYIESAAGVNAGGRTGLTAITIAGLIAASLFFMPLIQSFPAIATASALVVIGLLMMSPLRLKSLSDKVELLTVFTLMVAMTVTQNIGLGVSICIISYPVFMAASGKGKEIHAAFWGLAVCALLFLILYQY